MNDNTAVGFRLTLLVDPDDLDSRRIYADWLEDQASTDADRARLELLRLQVRMAEWVPDLIEREALLNREVALLARHGELVLGPLLSRLKEWSYQRGILHVEMSATQILQRSGRDDLVDQLRAAGAQVLRVETSARNIRRVLASPVLTAMPGLDLARTLPTPLSLRPLHEGRLQESLRWLDLSVNQLTDEFLEELIAGELLNHLVGLDLRTNRFTSSGIRRLLNACPDTLQRLELHGNLMEPSVRTLYLAFLADRSVLRSPTQPFQRLVNSLGMEFRLLPATTFRQGSPERETHRIDDEGPQHSVQLTHPYWIGLYQVTQQIYQDVMNENPSHHQPGTPEGMCQPVDSPTFDQAEAFCLALSNRPEELAAGRIYRLPTEAEWEFAGRGGLIQAPFAYGHSLTSFQANFDGNSPAGNGRRGPYAGRPVTVGSYPPNGFGLYDVHGNVWEWCSDWYESAYYTRLVPLAIDPRGPDRGDRRVVRGGSWFSNGSYCRISCRGSGAGVDHLHNGGFRVVMEQMPLS